MPIAPSTTSRLLATGIARSFLLRHSVCPRAWEADNTLALAVADSPLSEAAISEIEVAFDCKVKKTPVSRQELELLIERTTAAAAEVDFQRFNEDENDLVSDVRDLAAQPPVVRYVNFLVRDGYEAGASDIHLEATRQQLTARYRIDGVLSPGPTPPAELRHAIVSRIKLLAELDIAERRRPQDGRVRVRLETREIDLRISTVPTMHGESVVLRILDAGERPVDLDAVGLAGAEVDTFKRMIRRPHGLVLVTGPTGSGKTTTLYSALRLRSSETEKIITVEDPVEYQLTGIAQMPVNRDVGVTFASALRSILRQDPDVVMIGEMRDPETAETAIQAAMTGHLVLSTLHTNDALGAIPRLVDLGVQEYLIAATLEGVVAQRLVRKVCSNCRVEQILDRSHVAELTNTKEGQLFGYRGLGCVSCRGTGYRGRTGIFEILPVTERMRDCIARRATRSELRELAGKEGLFSLREDAWKKIAAGITSLEEVLRVLRD